MGESVRIAQGVLERDVAPERVTKHGPFFEAEPLAKRVGVCRQVLPCHGGDGHSRRPAVAAMIVEDQGELVLALPEREHGVEIPAGPPCINASGYPCLLPGLV